ncbi:MAG: ABC transporter permease subunit [Clostridia bacterium]
MPPGISELVVWLLGPRRVWLSHRRSGLFPEPVRLEAGIFGARSGCLMKQFMQTLPGEILDAGRIDGASEFGIFRLILAPLARPALAVLGIFTFVGDWNDLTASSRPHEPPHS